MKSISVNTESPVKSRKLDWRLYVAFLVIGLSVFFLSAIGYSKIVLLITSALSIVNVIYCGVFSRRWALAIFFAVLGAAAIAIFIFLPQSDSPFGWDKIASMFLGAVAGKISFMIYYHSRQEK
jgi:hypothetical protein